MAGKPQGEVAYYAPCGKKLRQYPDVMKVLQPHSAAVLVNDTEANVLRDTDEQFVTGVTVGIIISDWLMKDVFADNCSSTLLKQLLVYQVLLCVFSAIVPAAIHPHPHPTFCDPNSERWLS